MIVDKIRFDGKIELGHQVKIGYYAQNQSDFLNKNLSVLETIEESANSKETTNLRSILGSFLFKNDEVTKKIKVLSGGERARVSLCKLLLEPYNLLVMDEPTNHLDITSKELLKKALLNYNGSLIVVSHDREFLKGLTNKVYEFKNKKIKEYIGDIDFFLQEKKLDNFKQLENVKKDKNHNKSIKNKKQLSYFDEKEKNKKIKYLKNRINKLEKKIEDIDNLNKEYDIQLSDPDQYKELIQKEGFFDLYEKNQRKKEKLEQEWEEAIIKLDNIN